MIEQTLRELLEDKVTLDIEGIDRLYLNAYQPRLQSGGGVVGFFREHRGAQVASTTLMAPMSKDFVRQIHTFAKQHGIEMVRFTKGQRKDEVTAERLKDFDQGEGVLYIGVAQEKFAGFRVMKKISERTGTAFPWLYRSTVMCNQYYFYVIDEDFGPLFIKFSSYFPYTARICLNGHEYAKRQLAKAGIAHEALDNGVRSCADPTLLQQIADGLDEPKIEAVVRPDVRVHTEDLLHDHHRGRCALGVHLVGIERLAVGCSQRRLHRPPFRTGRDSLPFGAGDESTQVPTAGRDTPTPPARRRRSVSVSTSHATW